MATSVQPPTATISPAPSSAPLPAVTCYAVPYGVAGFINHLATLYMLCCLVNARAPLWPWRRVRHGTVSACICGLWVVLIISLNSSNLQGCVGENAPAGSAEVRWALGMIIVGKLVLTGFWSTSAIPNVGKNGKEKKKDEEAGSSVEGDATAAGDAPTSFTATEGIGATESPVQGQASVSLSGVGLGDEGGRLSPLARRSFDIPLPDPNESPPAYESIVSDTPRRDLPSASLASFIDHKHPEHATSDPAGLAGSSFSRDAATQTPSSPPPSPSGTVPTARAAAEALSAPVERSKSANAAAPTHIDDVSSMVLLFLNLGFLACVFAGTVMLCIATSRTGPAGDRATARLYLPFGFFLITITFAMLVGCAAQWRKDWKESRVRRGAYAELGEAENGEAGEASAHGAAAGGTDVASMAATATATATTTAERERIEQKGGLQLSTAGVGSGGASVPVTNQPASLPSTSSVGDQHPTGVPMPLGQNDAATTASPTTTAAGTASAAKPPRKSAFRLPFVIVPCGALLGIFTMWFADFAVGAAAGNQWGIPTKNISVWQWVAYLVVSKMPMLCF